MSRWHLLKSVVAGKRDCASESSIHKFTGFQLVERRKILWCGFKLKLDDKEYEDIETLHDTVLSYLVSIDTCACAVSLPFSEGTLCAVDEGVRRALWTSVVDGCAPTIEISVIHATLQPSMKVCCFYEHLVPCGPSTVLKLFTREKPKEGGLSAKALLSNKVHNVDNTGNICIWPAESILLHTLLNNAKYTSWISESSRIIELGGGLTALAGLGVAAWCSGLFDDRVREVVLTDGHPDCVINQKVCIEMCRQKQSIPSNFPISSHLLHWSIDSNSETINLLTKNITAQFDLIIASDCLFFRDFHCDLIQTILKLLSPTGRVIMLQPQRDGTLNQFVEKCEGYLDVQFDNYSDKVVQMRQEYQSLSDTNGYNDDIHYPIMLILTRKLS